MEVGDLCLERLGGARKMDGERDLESPPSWGPAAPSPERGDMVTAREVSEAGDIVEEKWDPAWSGGAILTPRESLGQAGRGDGPCGCGIQGLAGRGTCV